MRAENSRNTENAGTPKDADKATDGAAPTLPLETPAGDGTPSEQEQEMPKDETPSDTPASKTGAGTPPAPSFPAENSSNTKTGETPKDAGNATGGAGASPTLPLETPAGDGTPPDAPDGNAGGNSDNAEAGGTGNAGGTTADSEKTGGEENGNGEDGGKNQAGNPPAEGDNANRALDLPFEVKDGMVEVVSVKRAGKSVYATTGNLITFDKDGKATVLLADALHFLNVPGFEFK